MTREFDHLSDERLAEEIAEGWRDHWGRPSNGLAARLLRMEDALKARRPAGEPTSDERCNTCGREFQDHINGSCPKGTGRFTPAMEI